jgi:DNA-directed RNA polymerase specialized sigma subunit
MTKINYLSNKNLLAEIALSHAAGAPTDNLVKAFMLLVNRYANRANFRSYSYIDEMKSEALLHLVRGWDKFNPARSQNPFAYLTSCVNNAFLRVLRIEKKSRDVRDELIIMHGARPSFGYIERFRED